MDLFEQVISFQNLYNAYILARRAKRYRYTVLKFSENLEKNLCALRTDLLHGTYIHGGYREFIVTDSKKRTIQAAPFRDRVLHHALCSVIEPLFEKTFMYNSYACRVSKGTHRAVRRLQSYIQSHTRIREREREVVPSQIYCLKCDIRKYFNSVDHVVLLCLLRKQILDPRVLRLCELIVRSVSSGIPIGNLTSQLFANIYLNELDHYVKRTLHEKQYIRYMDDFVILSTDKKRLHADKKLIEEFLRMTLKLELHPKKSDIFLIERGIDFLGYRVFPHYLTLRKSTVKRRKKKFKELVWSYKRGDISYAEIENALCAWYGYVKHAQSWRIQQSVCGLVKNRYK